MEPKTKLQKEVASLRQTLPSLSKVQAAWAYKHCFEHIGRRMAKGTVCLECGHLWKDTSKAKNRKCPNCGMKLRIDESKKRVFNQEEYFGIITTCGRFQVLRFFNLVAKHKTGSKPDWKIREVVQRWIAPDGRFETFALLRNTFANYRIDSWSYYSGLEIRNNHSVYDVDPIAIYPARRYIPELKRNGFDGKFYDMTTFEIFRLLLVNNKAETLLKAKQYPMFKHCSARARQIDRYWPSIRICIRNNYIIPDPTIWEDYIDLLAYFGKDILNAKYVCPVDLRAAHDRLNEKKRRRELEEELEEMKKQIAEDEVRYNDTKGKFFGIKFSDDLIQIHVLTSVREFVEEGSALRHCVYLNRYHLKQDSLILSACIDGHRVETVEFSLSAMKVVQCRGILNDPTEHHERILSLVEKNTHLIRKKLNPKKQRPIEQTERMMV